MNSVPLRIKTNVLLHGGEPSMPLENGLAIKRGLELAGLAATAALAGVEPTPDVVANVSSVSDEQLRTAESLYGPGAVFRLMFLAFSHRSGDFKHFFRLIAEMLSLSAPFARPGRAALECDNARLPQSAGVARFSLNVLQPSLSRKLYNPGRHHGYLVYGIGGPRILVSHPFRGTSRDGELYDVYSNSTDVVTSLLLRGYNGTFLFLDSLPGLNFEVEGVPAWLVWFAIIAAHSDLVVFVKVVERGFSESQRRETELTPDRVQKKIVEIPDRELTWATEYRDRPDVPFLYVTGEPGSDPWTREQFSKKEVEHAGPFIELYSSGGFPRDRLMRIDESRNATFYPLDYELYES